MDRGDSTGRSSPLRRHEDYAPCDHASAVKAAMR